MGAVINLFFGRRLGNPGAGILAAAAVLGAFVIALLAVMQFVGGDTTHAHQIHLFPWIAWEAGRVELLVAEVGFMLDPLSSVMVLVVTGVGFLIHLYSIGYMSHEPSFPRFFTYLNLFTFSMLVLILANNFLLMFVGWELVGLCSYLLIGFWFTRPSAASAGKKAFIVNRVGDWAFLVGLFMIWSTFGTFQFFADAGAHASAGAAATSVLDDPATVLNRVADWDLGAMIWGAEAAGEWTLPIALVIALLLFIGATGKSAQVPLYIWLPDAMEGPTPVSALIHAATMVTAGVYMVARAHAIYDLAPAALAVVATVGAVTAIFAATIALVQTDIKRVLAYSTVSQLGYMFLALGTGAYAAGIFHLMTHAFFKALLFLGAGSVIHALSDEQDMRRMGGLLKYLKWTGATFLIGWLAIIGTPFFSGFFSKDLILAKTFERGMHDPWYLFLYALAISTVVLTAFYMSRLVFMTFFGDYRGAERELSPAGALAVPEHEPAAAEAHGTHGAVLVAGNSGPHAVDTRHGVHAEHDAHPAGGTHGAHGGLPHESPPTMLIPLVVLAILSVVGGWVGIPPFMVFAEGHGSWFENFLAPSVVSHAAGAADHGETLLSVELEWILTFVSVAAAATGVAVAALMYLAGAIRPASLAATFSAPYRWLSNKWYVDEFYQALIAHPGARLASFLAAFDLGVVDGAVNGVARAARGTGSLLRNLQSGYIRGYAATMLVGVFLVVAYWAFR